MAWRCTNVLVAMSIAGLVRGRPLGAQVVARGVARDTAMAVLAGDSAFKILLPTPLLVALLEASPELAARRAALRAATSRVSTTGFAPPATLSAAVEEVPGLRVSDANARVEVGREFLSGTRRSAERLVAAGEVRVSSLALDAARRRILANAARAYVQVLGWRAVAARLAGQDSLLGSAEISLRARFGVGQARYVDVLRLRTERLRVQNDRAQAGAEERTGTLALEGLIGSEGSVRLASIAPELVTVGPRGSATSAAARVLGAALPPAPTLDDLVTLAADVRLAATQVERAGALRGLTLARQRPVYSAALGLQRFAVDAAASRLGPTAAFGMTLPWSAGMANRAASAAADADVAAALASQSAVTALTRGALASARARYESDRARLASYDAALLLASREERVSALAAYRTGDLSLLELLDFERALAQAEIGRLRALLDGYSALTALLSGAVGEETARSSSLIPSSAQEASAGRREP